MHEESWFQSLRKVLGVSVASTGGPTAFTGVSTAVIPGTISYESVLCQDVLGLLLMVVFLSVICFLSRYSSLVVCSSHFVFFCSCFNGGFHGVCRSKICFLVEFVLFHIYFRFWLDVCLFSYPFNRFLFVLFQKLAF